MSFGKSSNWQGVTRPLRSPKLNHLHGLTRQHEVKLAGHDLRVLLMLASKIEARWGLIPHWAKDAKIAYSTINARAEMVATKPAFRSAYRARGHTFTCSALVQRPMLPTGRRVKLYRWQNAQSESAYHGVCGCRRSTPPSVRRTIKNLKMLGRLDGDEE